MIISNYIIVTIVDLLLLIHIMRHLSIHFELIIIIKPAPSPEGPSVARACCRASGAKDLESFRVAGSKI